MCDKGMRMQRRHVRLTLWARNGKQITVEFFTWMRARAGVEAEEPMVLLPAAVDPDPPCVEQHTRRANFLLWSCAVLQYMLVFQCVP